MVKFSKILTFNFASYKLICPVLQWILCSIDRCDDETFKVFHLCGDKTLHTAVALLPELHSRYNQLCIVERDAVKRWAATMQVESWSKDLSTENVHFLRHPFQWTANTKFIILGRFRNRWFCLTNYSDLSF